MNGTATLPEELRYLSNIFDKGGLARPTRLGTAARRVTRSRAQQQLQGLQLAAEIQLYRSYSILKGDRELLLKQPAGIRIKDIDLRPAVRQAITPRRLKRNNSWIGIVLRLEKKRPTS
jgi:hypothetical protein